MVSTMTRLRSAGVSISGMCTWFTGDQTPVTNATVNARSNASHSVVEREPVSPKRLPNLLQTIMGTDLRSSTVPGARMRWNTSPRLVTIRCNVMPTNQPVAIARRCANPAPASRE